MRVSIIVFLAAVSLFGTLTIPAPAFATDIDQARELCSKNPNCFETSPGLFCVNTEEDTCGHVVICEEKKPCRVVFIQPGGGKKHLGTKAAVKVLKSGAKLTTDSKSTTARIPGGGILGDRPGLGGNAPAGIGGAAPSAPPAPILK